ncbi:hypothetical protein BC830DRAFT_271507 [Chytriomyces sp. MP71]|nr:hypothetical protein BC830DRAFT_271507 [Chytriomyces sp. MP71]
MNLKHRLRVTIVLESLSSILNLTVAVFNIRYIRKLPPSSVLIVLLCLSDFGFNANNLITSVIHLCLPDSYYDSQACQLQGAITTLMGLLSMGLVAGLTLFRYLMIVRGYHIQPTFTIIYIASLAGISTTIVVFPFVLGVADAVYGLQPTKIACTVAWHEPRARGMAISCMIIIAIPIATISIAYFQIYQKVSREFKAFKDLSTTSKDHERYTASRHNINQCLTKEDQERQKSLLIQSVALVSCFLIGWTPYLIFASIQVITGEHLSLDFEFVAEMCIILNDIFSPILILIFDKVLRSNILNAGKTCCCRD